MNLDSRARSLYDDITQELEAMLSGFRSGEPGATADLGTLASLWSWVYGRYELACESPIEEKMGAALEVEARTALGAPIRLFRIPGRSLESARKHQCRERASDPVVLLVSQVQIGAFRVDFLLECWNAATGDHSSVVVECDGHDFHERTKEQASRDKSRDRELTAAGFRVLRFTGSEIHANPFGCARQAVRLVVKPAEDFYGFPEEMRLTPKVLAP